MNPMKQLTDSKSIAQSKEHYSRWHRPPNLPPWCLLADSDWFEMRDINGECVPVACIETMEIGALFLRTAQNEYPLWDTKRNLLQAIIKLTDLPVYIVRHPSDMKLISVARLRPDGEECLQKIMDEDEYKEFLMGLGIQLIRSNR